MSQTMPMRMDGDLVDAAKAVGAVSSRSATQLSHWARIGRELEASPVTSPCTSSWSRWR
ncbi:ParD-like family protein [Leifsonia shinshuensis]|uniref:ParD-like family protein n=1 Tax=Leifsonia shinshuensis TaxID=150026 RepID=UPI001F50A26D|nr:ParD-like family protein [Leifsonia shinshuensis]MCI0157854.1 ParD-like family protein [Leifsonia shinshuensis]